MKISYLIPLLALASLHTHAAQPMCIVKSGRPSATIILGKDATAPERFAAKQLAETIKKVSGATLPIVDTAPNSGTRIFVGQTAYTKKLMKGFNWQTLRRDGILIRTIGRDLLLAGDRPRGSIYAVQELLETQLGVRYWAPSVMTVPQRRTVNLPAMNVVYTPKLMYREPFYTLATSDPLYAVQLRANGHHQPIPENMGGHYSLLGWCHTAYDLLPPKDYFSKHPDWYGFVNGARRAEGTQLCLTNPEMKTEMIKNALGWIRKQPEAGIISITQNDWIGPCQCELCQQLVKQTGSQSGALISFVNDVAAAIEKQYPDFLIETLAYQYTRQAPTNIKPRANVIVRLCSIENDFGRPITAPENAAFYKDLMDWKKITKRLYIWNYTVNFASSLIPHPNITILGDDLRTFTNNNVIGMFEQGDNYNRNAAMAPLKTYLLSKLMWNPNQPEMPIMKDFLDGYYGPAGKPLLKAVLLMEAARKRSGQRLPCYYSYPDYFTIADLVSLKRNFDQAEAAVKNKPEMLLRVQIQRLAFDHVLILTKRKLEANQQAVAGVNWTKLVDHFVGLSNSTKNNWYREGGRWDDNFRSQLKTKIKPFPRYNFGKATSAMGVSGVQGKDWLDIQEDKFELFEDGTWVFVVADDKSSNGYVAEMPNTHTQWAVQHTIRKAEIKWPKVDVSLGLRVMPAAGATGDPTSGVVRFGVYDPSIPSDNFINLTVADIKPGYQRLVIENIALKAGMYLYVAPEVNGSMKSIRVDRFTIQPHK